MAASAETKLSRDQPRESRLDTSNGLAYWLLTGHRVFESRTSMQLLIDHASAAPARPQTRTELPIPADLEQLIMDCLEKDPARRPATAETLAQLLSACRLSEPWTHERAEGWWQTHVPAPGQDRPVAEVLLSREATPAMVRALRPRHATGRVSSR